MSTSLLNYHLRLFFVVFVRKLLQKNELLTLAEISNLNFQRQETAIRALPARTQHVRPILRVTAVALPLNGVKGFQFYTSSLKFATEEKCNG